MGDMKNLKGFDGVKNWTAWRENVKERIAIGHRFGISDETIKAIGIKIGNYLTDRGSPTTSEEELLKEMWKVATPDERKTITTLIFKMVQ